jgi:uncharacterized protein
MTLAVTGTYAAVLTVFYVVLSARIILYRRQNSISLGDGGDGQMLRRIRAHANFAEYVPLGIILLGIAEQQDEAALWLHLVGGLLLTGRLAHGINFSFGFRSALMRTGGMALTFGALLIGAGLALPL